MAIGIPYTEAIQIPIDMAVALLSDERPNNTHPRNQRKSRASNTQPSSSSTGTTYVATKRKHSKPKT